MKIREILAGKGSRVIAIPATESVSAGIAKMVEQKVGALLVLNARQEPAGIITERDILRQYVQKGPDLDKVTLEQVMTRDIIVGTPEMEAEDALTLMTNRRFRHMPVVEKGQVVGFVSIGDLVKAQLRAHEVEVKFLRDYLNSPY